MLLARVKAVALLTPVKATKVGFENVSEMLKRRKVLIAFLKWPAAKVKFLIHAATEKATHEKKFACHVQSLPFSRQARMV